MSKYYVEYGALQANAERLIECDTSALPAKKITEKFATEIADALNRQNTEEGAETTGDSQAIRDTAKLRKALLSLLQGWDIFINGLEEDIDGHYPIHYDVLRRDYERHITEARAALSAPPRQCDVGSEEEQSRRYDAFCEAHHMQCDKGCSACPCSKKSGVSCELYWAQMPYKAEGAEK